MDVIGRLTRELDNIAPVVAGRIRFRREASQGYGRALVRHLVRRGDTTLDIGAQIGIYTAGMLSCVGRTGAVHAFEPHPAHLRLLQGMSRHARNLTVHAVALSDRDATSELLVPVVGASPNTGMGSLEDLRPRMDADFVTLTVRTSRLDVALNGVARVDFMKIDVEGHEDHVLSGADGTLTRFRPHILIEIEHRHRGKDPKTTIDRLLDLGLDGWALFADGLRPVSEFDVERDQLKCLDATDGVGSLRSGYVSDFLFTRANTQLGRLLAPRRVGM